MAERTCPFCAASTPHDLQKCACGYDFRTGVVEFAEEEGDSPRDTGPLPLAPYRALRLAVRVIRVLAVVAGVLGLVAWVVRLSSQGFVEAVASLFQLGLLVFFLWVSGEVIRILVDIRDHQLGG